MKNKYNKLCITCTYTCKQLPLADIISCKFIKESSEARKLVTKLMKDKRRK